MSKVIGIDLGTTNSCVAVVESGEARVLAGRTGQRTMPSVVAVTKQGKRLVGHLAKRQAITNAADTIYGAKRLIGRRWESPDVQRALRMLAFDCAAGPHGDVRVRLAGREYAVPEISSMVLQEMRLVAEKALGAPVSQAVITVPAYFNDNQRQATKDAGNIAGLEVLRIINEPTAAALAYGFGRGLNQRIAVYDLGGGTFDISILEIGDGVFEVLASAGDTFLGGEDFDDRIIAWLAESFHKEHSVDLREDRMALQRLRDAAELAKIELSTATETEINLPFIYSRGKGDALHLQQRLSRDTLNELVGDLIARTLQICEQALADAKLGKQDVAAILLVGGMTRMPRVQEAIEHYFGRPAGKGVHPDEAVACGAAIQGHLLSSGSSETLLLDVTPHNLGIMVAGGLFDRIIEKDTTIPTSAKKTFTTVRDEQTQVRIIVMQGDASDASENELLGEFVLDGLRKATRGEVQLEVTFDISADGIVSVSARDVETGRAQAITVTAASGLTADEIAKMTMENREEVVVAVANAAFEQERLEVERALRDIDKLLPEARAVIDGTEFGADALRKATETIQAAREAILKRDAQALAEARPPIERTRSMLSNVLQRLRK